MKPESRGIPDGADVLRLNMLALDMQGRSMYNGEKSVKFSMKEFKLLQLMVMNMDRVLTREFILEQVWGAGYHKGTRTVDVHIRNIRRKLSELDDEHYYIECVRRSGYRFKDRRKT